MAEYVGSTHALESAPEEREIPLTNLKLDELNYRTDEVDSQRAALRAMIDEQGPRLVTLAEHILEHGLFPGERILVIPDDEEGEEDSFVVMEGNRRLASFKLMTAPELAANTPYHSTFQRLSQRLAANPIRALPCAILRDRETAEIWIEVKHSTAMGGAGVEKWSAPAMTRWEEERGRVRRWRAVMRFLEEQGVNIAPLQTGLHRKTTAVDRVLNSGAMRTVLGVHIAADGSITFENGDIRAGKALLTSMMNTMAGSEFSTNEVHSLEDREAFIVRYADQSVLTTQENTPQIATDDTTRRAGHSHPDDTRYQPPNDTVPHTARTGSETGGTTRAGGGRRRASARLRNTLASRRNDDRLFIVDDRLNDLYRTALNLNVNQHPALAAVLIRVFLELTCEHYLSDNRVPVPNKPRAQWHDYRVRLREKIQATVQTLNPSRQAPDLNDVRRGLGSNDHAHSPARLHDYVHGLRTVPISSELIGIWDRYQALFSRVFSIHT